MSHNRHSDEEYRPEKNSGLHDPLVNAQFQSNAVNIAWFKDGERLNFLQRFGFIFISLAFIACGGVLLTWWWNSLREGDTFWAVAWIVSGLLMIILGCAGGRNALRFHPKC
jgi:hypothetical protein